MATKKSTYIVIGMVVIIIWLLGFVIEAQAETMKCKIARVVTKEETMPVSDEEGHALFMQMSEGLAFFENGDIATVKTQTISDRATGTGKGSQAISYVFFTFEDGSSIVVRVEYRSMTDPSGKISSKTTGEIIKGTARFVGIKGAYSSTGKYFPAGKGEANKASADATITYTLPSK
jgi:hypothetical protein